MKERLIGTGLRTLDRLSPWLAAQTGMRLFITPNRHPRSESENLLWAFGRELSVPSGRAWRRFGQERGPTILFTHGWESRGSAFHAWIRAFAETGYDVLAWDLPAHGDSPGQRTTMIEAVTALDEDLKALKIRPRFAIGHSFGGACTHWARLTGTLDPEISVAIGSPSRVENVVDQAADRFGFGPRSRQEFKRALLQRTGIRLEDVDFRVQASRLRTPTLLVHDRRDKEVPFSEAENLHAALPSSVLMATEGWGHRRILTAPDVIAEVLTRIQGTSKSI